MLERTISTVIQKTSKGFPVLLITGMRQVGKSTILSMLDKNRKYVSLDNLKDRQLAKNDPELFLKTYEPPIIIDEIQYAPELFPYIKIWVDKNKMDFLKNNKTSINPSGAFWLTGSQKFSLMKGVQESLAGRVAILDLLGLSQKEILQKPFESKPFLPSMEMIKNDKTYGFNTTDIYRSIFNGSFPEPIVNQNIERDIFYKSYIKTYIERDVKDFYGINDSLKFYNFVVAVAVRTGNLINYSDLARDVDIDMRTAKLWLSILERSGIIKLLQPYYTNVSKRMIKTPKIYFLDTGLCSYLANIDTPEALESSYLSGSILESFVFIEILKSYWHNGKEANIYFYRDTDQKEIDFIIEKNATLYPIEVKKTSMPDKKHIKTYDVLQKLNKTIGTGAVICLTDRVRPIDENNLSIPIQEI